MAIYFIDFEASSLSEKVSYPIEVAWGSTLTDVKSFLIKPLPHWTDWDPESGAIHGIPRDTLAEDGVLVEEVNAWMGGDLNGEKVFSDCPFYDTLWRDRLVIPGELPGFDFKIGDLRMALEAIIYDKVQGTAESVFQTFEKIRDDLESRRGRRHRAAEDVKQMIRLYEAVLQFEPKK